MRFKWIAMSRIYGAGRGLFATRSFQKHDIITGACLSEPSCDFEKLNNAFFHFVKFSKVHFFFSWLRHVIFGCSMFAVLFDINSLSGASVLTKPKYLTWLLWIWALFFFLQKKTEGLDEMPLWDWQVPGPLDPCALEVMPFSHHFFFAIAGFEGEFIGRAEALRKRAAGEVHIKTMWLFCIQDNTYYCALKLGCFGPGVCGFWSEGLEAFFYEGRFLVGLSWVTWSYWCLHNKATDFFLPFNVEGEGQCLNADSHMVETLMNSFLYIDGSISLKEPQVCLQHLQFSLPLRFPLPFCWCEQIIVANMIIFRYFVWIFFLLLLSSFAFQNQNKTHNVIIIIIIMH